MKRIYSITSITFTVLFLISCSGAKKVKVTNSVKQPKELLFEKSLVTTSNGASNFMSVLTSMGDTINTEHKNDVLKFANSLTNSWVKNIPKDTLSITIKKDSIWRHRIYKGRQIGDYDLVMINDSIRYKVGRDRKYTYGRYNLFKNSKEYKVTEFPEDKKVIMGLNCHKMVITRLEPDSHTGNTIYELYVTNELNLPLHTVFNIGKFIPKTFTAEITIKSEKLLGMTENYQLVEIR